MDTTGLKSRLNESKIVRNSTGLYRRYERFVPALSFFAGFLWDNLTLTRIDLWTDNLILATYLLLVGILIVVINLADEGVIQKPILLRYRDWYPLAMQFLLGGLFSSYVVFFFRSGTLAKNWLFLLFLVLVLIGNEFIKDRLTNLKLQFTLFFLASFSFFIFSVPVVLKYMNTWVFLLSGCLSLAMVQAVLFLVFRFKRDPEVRSRNQVSFIIIGLFVFLNLLYFMNWIPPVPLSLRSGGIYHHVSRLDEHYRLRYEQGTWYEVWKKSDNIFHYQSGDSVFCFSAVFAPTRLDKTIIHRWQFYNEKKETWLTTDRLSFQITGGRDGGYRGYSFKENIQHGEWRVDVETREGLLLGRINFEVVPAQQKNYPMRTIRK